MKVEGLRRPRQLSLAYVAGLVVIIVLGLTSTAGASALRLTATELVPNGSFEQGVSGWGGYHATLVAVSDGVVGPGAAKVTLTSGFTDYSIVRWPRPVTSTVAGTAYSGAGWLRSDLPGASVCLYIREWSSANAVVSSASRCLTASVSWQQFQTVSYTTKQSGGSLELFVYQIGTPSSSSFEVDGLSLTTGAPDTTPPDTTIDSGPSGTTTETGATFGFTSTESGSAFSCALDSAAFAACTSPTTYSGLAAGSHTFQVKATDAAGNVDETPASRTWSISSPAPPPPPSSNLLPNGSFEQGVSGWGGYHSTLAAVSDGPVGLGAAKVMLSAGFTDYSLVRWPRPVTSTTAGTIYLGDGWVRSDAPGGSVCVYIREWSSANTVVSSAGSCITARSTWQRFGTVRYATRQSGGSLELYVYQSGAPAGSSFELDDLKLVAGAADSTPPDTQIASGPSGTVTSTSGTFAFTSNESGSTFECALDGAAFSPCTSPSPYSGLAMGGHAFQARAIDPAGNIDPTPAMSSWTIASVVPDPTLLAAGDIAGCSSNGDEATAALLGQFPGATVAPLGDNAYDHGSSDDYANCYDPSWGAYRTSSRPAVGNHDYDTAGAAGYFGYFLGAAADPTKGYYSYDMGKWHLVVLNSNCAQVGGCAAGSAQEAWLSNDLSTHKAPCTLAYWHAPLFTSGGVGPDGAMRAFWEDLYSAHADVVLNGHAHMYERFALQDPNGTANAAGIREFVAGTGGYALYALGTIAANSQVLNNTAFGILKLTLHSSSYDWQFVPVAGQTFTDSGSASCHGSG